MRGHFLSQTRKFNRHWQSGETFKLWLELLQGHMGAYTSEEILVQVASITPVNPQSGQGFLLSVYEANTDRMTPGYAFTDASFGSAIVAGGCHDLPKFTAQRDIQCLGGVVDPRYDRYVFAVEIESGGCYAQYYDSGGNFISQAQLTDYQISLRYSHQLPSVYYYKNKGEYLANPHIPPHRMQASQTWWHEIKNGINQELRCLTPFSQAFSSSELAQLDKYPCFILSDSSSVFEQPRIEFFDTLTPPAGATRTEYYTDMVVKVGFGIS